MLDLAALSKLASEFFAELPGGGGKPVLAPQQLGSAQGSAGQQGTGQHTRTGTCSHTTRGTHRVTV